jgi:hypothetical protein
MEPLVCAFGSSFIVLTLIEVTEIVQRIPVVGRERAERVMGVLCRVLITQRSRDMATLRRCLKIVIDGVRKAVKVGLEETGNYRTHDSVYAKEGSPHCHAQ